MPQTPSRRARVYETPPSRGFQNALLLFAIAFLAGLGAIMFLIPPDRYVPMFDVTPQSAAPGTHTSMLLPLRLVALAVWIGCTVLALLAYMYQTFRRRR